MRLEGIGCGAGDADFSEHANILRLMFGQTDDARASDQVSLLETNLDDSSGELVGYTCSLLMEAGALDVYTTAIQMKKNRPGVMVSVLCQNSDVDKLRSILFRETTTLGIRCHRVQRAKLTRVAHSVKTNWGEVQGKLVSGPEGVKHFAPEFESCRQLASEHRVPLRAIFDAARRAFDAGRT